MISGLGDGVRTSLNVFSSSPTAIIFVSLHTESHYKQAAPTRTELSTGRVVGCPTREQFGPGLEGRAAAGERFKQADGSIWLGAGGRREDLFPDGGQSREDDLLPGSKETRSACLKIVGRRNGPGPTAPCRSPAPIPDPFVMKTGDGENTPRETGREPGNPTELGWAHLDLARGGSKTAGSPPAERLAMAARARRVRWEGATHHSFSDPATAFAEGLLPNEFSILASGEVLG